MTKQPTFDQALKNYETALTAASAAAVRVLDTGGASDAVAAQETFDAIERVVYATLVSLEPTKAQWRAVERMEASVAARFGPLLGCPA